MYIILIICCLFFTSIYINLHSALALVGVYLVGYTTVSTLCKSDKHINKLYNILFIFGSIYLVACYLFMREHGYQWLLAYDAYDYFIPQIEMYLEAGKYDYFSVLSEIYKDFEFFRNREHLYFTYSCLWGIVSHICDIDLYYTIQLSVLLLFLYSGIVLYKIILLNNINKNKAVKYSIIICTCSTLFFYSSQILRDVHILLLSLIAIYYTFKPTFSTTNIIKILLCIIAICGLRIESGLFMFVLIPAYQFVHFKTNSNRLFKFITNITLLVSLTIIILLFSTDVESIFNANREHYIDDISEGSGIIGTLQKFPIVGSILSILYNAIQPFPFWYRLAPSQYDTFGYEAYNIMGFVRFFSTYFHFAVIVYITTWLFNTKLRKNIWEKINKPMRIQLWIGLIFLYLQSAVVDQRRLMPYYCIFCILFFIIYSNITPKVRKDLNLLTITLYIILQILGGLFLIVK